MKKYDVKTKIGIILMLISISGLFGFIYEFIFYYFNGGMKEFYWCGGNFLPWINIYAIGALLIIFLSYKYRKKPLKVLLISIISTGLLELISGYLIYELINKRFWDYNTEILNFGNIGGYVCLRSVLVFAFAGLFIIYVLLPFLIKLVKSKHFNIIFIISIILCSIFLIDELYNLIFANLLHLPNAEQIYTGIGIKYIHFS